MWEPFLSFLPNLSLILALSGKKASLLWPDPSASPEQEYILSLGVQSAFWALGCRLPPKATPSRWLLESPESPWALPRLDILILITSFFLFLCFQSSFFFRWLWRGWRKCDKTSGENSCCFTFPRVLPHLQEAAASHQHAKSLLDNHHTSRNTHKAKIKGCMISLKSCWYTSFSSILTLFYEKRKAEPIVYFNSTT